MYLNNSYPQAPYYTNPQVFSGVTSGHRLYPFATNSIENGVYGVINGYTLYKPGFGPSYGPNVPSIPKYMISKFGWKITEHNGMKYWVAMDEKDYRIEIGKMLGMNPEEVDLSLVQCGSLGDTGCHGDCPDNRFCIKIGGSEGTFCTCSAYLNRVVNFTEKNETILRPRQWLTLINNTNRQLYLKWEGSTHTGDPTESYLNPGEKDAKKSERTNDANFVVKINRLKNGEWLESGVLTEHVSGEMGSEEYYNLITYRFHTDPEDLIRFGKTPTNMDAPETISTFKIDEW